MNKKNYKKIFTPFIKASISFVPIYFILQNIDINITIELIINIGWLYLVTATLILCLQILLMSYRWKVVLDNLRIKMIFKNIISILWIGLFFNQILPSSIGGDAFRGYYLYRKGFSLIETSQGVLTDRIIGLIALVILVIITLPLGFELVDSANAKLGLIIILAFVVSGLFAILNLDKLTLVVKRWNFVNSISLIIEAVKKNIFSINPGIGLLLISLLAHCLSILTIICLSKGMGLEIELAGLLLIVPLVTLLMMVPISIAGWGVREGAMIIGLGSLGVEAENAFALSLIYGFLTLLVSIPGGPIWIITNEGVD